ncbi:hypothetical protein AAVH_33728, partial [Aphelenchoides avenae]
STHGKFMALFEQTKIVYFLHLLLNLSWNILFVGMIIIGSLYLSVSPIEAPEQYADWPRFEYTILFLFPRTRGTMLFWAILSATLTFLLT